MFEAKNENIKGGLGQCTAAMLAARLFNEREGKFLEPIYGAVTTGNQWKFLSLKGNTAYIDLKDYYIDQVDSIMGILSRCSQRRLIPDSQQETGQNLVHSYLANFPDAQLQGVSLEVKLSSH